MQLAETRIRDFGGQRETLVRQYDEAERQRQSLEQESQAVDDDGGAALDAARETVSRLQDELNAVEARRREVDGRIISAGRAQRRRGEAARGRWTDHLAAGQGRRAQGHAG